MSRSREDSVTGAASIMSLEGVTKRFSTRANDSVLALDKIALDIQRNQFVTLVGPSGCGKSTLLKIMSGVIAPTGGAIRFDGSRLTKPSRQIGMVFQRPVLLPWRP